LVKQVVVTFQESFLTLGVGFVKFEVDENGLLGTEILLPDIKTSLLSFSLEVVAIWEQNELADPD